MALNTTGPISLAGTTAGQSVQLELGGNGSTMISLNDANVRSLAGVASGAISLSNLYGKSNAAAISLSNYTVYSFGTDVAATSTYTLSSTGDITRTISGDTSGTLDIGDWISPKSGMSNYECLATLVSGTFSTTAGTGVWLNLGTSRSWSRSKGAASSGISNCVFTLQIRQVGTTTVLASATITLSAEVSSSGAVMTL